jgi:O-antigen/teichoic acid export membrane protein
VVCAVLTVATIGRYGIEGAAVATTVAYAGAFLVKAWAFSSSTGIAMHELFVPRLGEVAAAVRAPLGRLRARTP